MEQEIAPSYVFNAQKNQPAPELPEEYAREVMKSLGDSKGAGAQLARNHPYKYEERRNTKNELCIFAQFITCTFTSATAGIRSNVHWEPIST